MDRAEQVTFVVRGREFVAPKEDLDIILNGTYDGSTTSRIDLDDSISPDDFAVYMNFYSGSTSTNVEEWKQAFGCAENLKDPNFAACLKRSICQIWEQIENVDSVISLAENFNFTRVLWEQISTDVFHHIRKDLNIVEGFMQCQKEDGLQPIAAESDSADGYSTTAFSNSGYKITNGILNWLYENCSWESLFDSLSSATRLDFVQENLASKLFRNHMKLVATPRSIIERAVNRIRDDILAHAGRHIYAGCTVPYGFKLMEFDPVAWTWKDKDYGSKPVAEYYKDEPAGQDYRYFCTANPLKPETQTDGQIRIWNHVNSAGGFAASSKCYTPRNRFFVYLRNFIVQDGFVYVVGVKHNCHAGSGAVMYIEKADLRSPEPEWCEVAWSCIHVESRISCQLVQVGDTLHAFLSGKTLGEAKGRFGLWHFALDLSKNVQGVIRLKPLANNLSCEVNPLAGVACGRDVLVLLSYRGKHTLCVLFDTEHESLRVLGHLPSLAESRDIEQQQVFILPSDSTTSQ